MISLSASTPTLISDLGYTFPTGITSLISPGDLFTADDIRGSNDMENALTGGTINIVDEYNVKLTTIKNIGLGDVGSGKAIIKDAIFSNLSDATISSSTIVIDGVTAQTTDTFVTAATLNSTTLELERNGGLSDVTVDLSSISGGGSNTFVSGGTYNEPTTSDPKLEFVGNSSETTFNVLTNVFGTYYHYAEDLSQQQDNNTTYATILTLTTGTVPDGIYRVGWSYEWRHYNATDRDIEIRCQIDGANVMEVNIEAKDKNSWHGMGGFANVTFGSNGTHTITFDAATEASQDPWRIRNLRLEFWRVSS
jgi:hypothetical protein